MDEPVIERLNRLQLMLEMLCEQAAELKAEMDANRLRHRESSSPSEESKRPMTPVPDSRR